jgi:transcription elongation factor SPT6
MISAEGELSDYIKLPELMTSRKTWNEKQREKKEKEIEILTMFIRNKRPHGIAICTDDRNATTVARDLEDLIHQMTADDASFPPIKVILVDNNLAKVYANTNKSNTDFRDHPPVLKQAISVGRRLQDPLVEFSQLCNPENDILCLRYHTHQEAVGEEILLSCLNQVFINIVNKVGVDINECVAHPHTSNLVQFIGGLGPRKGASLLKTLRSMSNPRLENRQQLVTSCHMGPKVFINCAGFVKIDTTALGDSEQYIEVLDGSRIHNEAYEWARKMAVDALEYDDEEDEGNPASAVEDILRQPEKLEELNLDAFAEELERQGFGNKQITLYDIRDELNNMYGEKREPYSGPTDVDIFDITNKETPDTFYVGKLMMARVTGFYYVLPKPEEMDCAQPQKNDLTGMFVCQFCGRDDFPELTEVWNHFDAENDCPGKCLGVKVVLENAIPGFISIQELSDTPVLRPEDRVKVNMNIHVRVTKILPDKGRVNCTSRTSALRDENEDFQRQKDDFYDTVAHKKAIDKLTGKLKLQQGTQYIKRVIIHPQFHNISYKEAEKLLKEQDQGDVVVRPSSKGKDHLTVTWKVTDGIYQHIDVEERGKTNDFSLGASLIIAGEEFEDLDEIIARHINPMAANAREILNYKYYESFTDRKEAESFLIKKRANDATKIHYCVYPDTTINIPGKFMLSYAIKNKIRNEYVSVTPDGFRFRKQNFDALLSMIKWFKEHFRDPIPITPNMGRRTPYGSVTGGTTPGGGTTGRPGITPGALSVAGGNTPYGGTPGSRYNSNAYTPTANTPFMTPVATTPGPSNTPRGYGAMGTPRSGAPGGGRATPNPQRVAAPGGGRATPGASPAYKGRGSNAGNAWAEAAQNWAGGGGRTPRGMAGDVTPRGAVAGGENTPSYNRAGYSTTPRYDDKSRGTPQYTSGRTPQYNTSSSRQTPQYNSGSRTPQQHGGRTPQPPRGDGSRTPQYPPKSGGSRTPQPQHHSSSGGSRKPSQPPRTPRGQFGDATPLYDE